MSGGMCSYKDVSWLFVAKFCLEGHLPFGRGDAALDLVVEAQQAPQAGQ